MLVDIDTPYADTTAADLSLAIDGPERPALHVLTVTLPGLATVHLRLLGASHQVVLDISGTAVRSETVACLPGADRLPREMHDDAGRYRFTSRVLRLDRVAFVEQVATLRDELTDDPHALVGVFPGDRDAVTALRVRPDGERAVRWQTWHAYPQTGELVQTETVVTP
ncbi:DUF2617 family protein [Plantactinospora sp. GCM10030261]|uniref:DUF2617 family protein n=1 Tax=Plantactinospora sp. GCM10030261 TaxID=3273420 RepID=UPI003621E3E6